jgi:alpha-tubulin suppressor-like RCC1 family protein
VNTPSLVAVVNVFTTVRAGGAHTCGIVPSGFAWCWGFAQSGQLGNGQSGAFELQAQPDSVRTDLTFVAVATGGEHTCALTAAGEAYCWGLNTEGQLGNGTQANSTLPVAVSGGLTFAAIDAGGRHTCGITPGGQAYCWGLGESGQLGIGTTPTTVQVPTAVSGGLTFSAIDLGGSHTCALTPTKTAYCWGLNDAGQLGDGTEEMRSAPTAVAGDQTTFDTIEAGSGLFATVTCGMGTDGFAYCWGEGSGGQLGWGSLSSSSTPVQVKGQVGQ